MLSLRKILSLVLIVNGSLLGEAVALPSPPIEKRGQCQKTLDVALSTAHRMQDHYWNSFLGKYNGGELWTDANAIEDLHNLMLATGTNDFGNVADSSYIAFIAGFESDLIWKSALGGSNDDAQWIILALWKIADYKTARGQSAAMYMKSASIVYDIVAAEWDSSTCGGGVWWSKDHNYKNAITNELFLLTSASGYSRGGGQKYLDNAKKTWNWLKNSGMRNGDGLWNDGLTSDCRNNGQETWIYNQGVIASGLAALYQATGDASLLTEAEITLDATIAHKTVNNILKESCDDVSPTGSACNKDQQIFKGIWTKHVQFYLDMANSADRINKYRGFLGSQDSAVFHYGTAATNDIGSVWYAPSGARGGSAWTPASSTSGVAAHIAAAKYGPC